MERSADRGRMTGEETEPVNHMLALHRSLTSSLYKNRLQASSNMWSCIIVTLSALVGGGVGRERTFRTTTTQMRSSFADEI
jgi:hypothetical protein